MPARPAPRALGDAIGARALEQAREQLAKRTGSLQRQAGLCRSAGATVVATAAGAGIGRPDSSDASDAEDSEEARARGGWAADVDGGGTRLA